MYQKGVKPAIHSTLYSFLGLEIQKQRGWKWVGLWFVYKHELEMYQKGGKPDRKL